jgi:hypothetical protein
MRHLILALCYVCLLLSSCFFGSTLLYLDSDSQGKTNILKNHDFERSSNDDNQLPEGWYIVSSIKDEVVQMSLDSLVVHSGKKSIRIRNSSKNLFLVSEAFKVNYTGGYYARGYFKAEKRTKKPLRLYFWAYNDAGDKVNSFQRSIKARPEWRRVGISAGFMKNSASFARIAIFIPKASDNTIWIDDAGCYLVHQFNRE